MKWAQIDLARGLVHLNPEGRQQTNKFRAVIPLCPVAHAEVKSWTRTGEHVIEYYGAPLATNNFFENLLAEAGVEDCSPKTLRHTVRTWLAEHDVVGKRCDLFMGHSRPVGQGSRTGAKYIHLKPSYLADVREAIDELFLELQPLIKGRRPGRV
jgi:integrase